MWGDNVGATDLKLVCSSSTQPSEIVGGILELGSWREKRECSKGTAICGLRTQVDSQKDPNFFQGIFKKCQYDNTGLNNVDMTCCKIPDPAETCQPDIDNIWVDELGCGEKLACKKIFKKGLSYSKSNSQTVKENVESYRNIGTSLEGSASLMKSKFEQQLGSKKINGMDLSKIFGQISTEEETIKVNMSECHGRMQQMVLKCGIIEAKTGMFRCVEGNTIYSINSVKK